MDIAIRCYRHSAAPARNLILCATVASSLYDELNACKERIRELEEVTEILRESAQAFGALADRLNARLREARRHEAHARAAKLHRKGD
jgi:hypothetical protein